MLELEFLVIAWLVPFSICWCLSGITTRPHRSNTNIYIIKNVGHYTSKISWWPNRTELLRILHCLFVSIWIKLSLVVELEGEVSRFVTVRFFCGAFKKEKFINKIGCLRRFTRMYCPRIPWFRMCDTISGRIFVIPWELVVWLTFWTLTEPSCTMVNISLDTPYYWLTLNLYWLKCCWRAFTENRGSCN